MEKIGYKLASIQNKPKLRLIDPDFIEIMARIMDHGERKYGECNWMYPGLTVEDMTDAMERHVNAIKRGEYEDPDSGFPHVCHIACSGMFLHWYNKEGRAERNNGRWTPWFNLPGVRNPRGAQSESSTPTSNMSDMHGSDSQRENVEESEGIAGSTCSGCNRPNAGGTNNITRRGIKVHSSGDKAQVKRPCYTIGDIGSFQLAIAEWANKLWPNRTVKQALIKMVAEEIPELMQGDSIDPLEYADVAILLFDAAALAGIDIGKAIQDKMEINRSRSWVTDPDTGLNHRSDKYKEE